MSTAHHTESQRERVIIRLLQCFIGGIILVFGWIGYLFINGFNSVQFTSSNYVHLLFNEAVVAAKPVFICLVPAFFIALPLFFRRIRWKLDVGLVLLGGIIFILPSYIKILLLWQPLIHVISDLPVTEIHYHRTSLNFSSPDHMTVTFVIPNVHFPAVEKEIEKRLARRESKEYGYLSQAKDSLSGKIRASLIRWN